MTEPTSPGPTATDAERAPSFRAHDASSSPALGIGALLIVVGLLLFVGQATDVGLDDVGWPIIVVAVGAVILGLGLFVNREQAMVIAGTVVTAVGLVLLYQNSTGHWQSWAYAWALVGPAASGLGLLLWGVRTAHGGDVRNGTWGLLGGLGLFLVGYLFFEGVIGISGQRLPLPEWLLPAAIIGIGVVLLVRAMVEGRKAAA